ncbi:MAG: FHA domain-containing protein [Anaerolineae bacterium]|nr:FHA domain-containing protein [Anaerolineae bacterium]
MNQDIPMLVIQNGQLAGQRWLLDSDYVVMGREVGGTNLLLPERQISRRHAEIVRKPDGFWLRDLGRKNGTF